MADRKTVTESLAQAAIKRGKKIDALTLFVEDNDVNLDDAVHDAKAEEASCINNGGKTEQIPDR